ncbi:uncharacterized protein LOC124895688 [Capsicum annuum]|uniref:uncharacterized protein LOC124895630 n=1 Tax=Capsicum annuum TaxID=4072 RepID=UPI001FB0B2FD|nr:uncharacterized protein LOC124895630 [Capsicum annuum]XP_047262070.1 uncharacterized protein LOC124895681 [Capsicum annuum]XP_047262075.1 uncharacterized protein LOC124895688 [Capsicum annuum]
MDRNAFHTLVLLTKNIGGLSDSKSMSSNEKLAIFLNILAHHEKNRSIKVDYIRSRWSVSQAFNECLCAILKLTPLLLVNPKPILKDETEDRWKWFEGCLGALDGTYIPIRVPTQYKPRYMARKREIATNILGVCDRNLNFREMEVDPLDSDMKEQAEYQHKNIDVVESSEEWSSWRNELAQRMWYERTNN